MGVYFLLPVSGAYLYVAWSYATQGRWGMCLAFAAYALANAGFLIDLYEVRVQP